MKMILKSKKILIISILLLTLVICIFLKFKNKDIDLPQMRRLTSSSTNIEFEIKYTNETIKCLDNSTFLPLIYTNFNNLTEISYNLGDKEEKISVCYTSKNEKIYGINLTGHSDIYEINLTILNITTNAYDLSSLFENNSIITEIKFSSSQIGNLKIISNMFKNCTKLKIVDFGEFTFDGITDVSNLFNGCVNLEKIIYNYSSNTTEITTMEGMFSGCEKINIIYITIFNFKKVENIKNIFNGCKNLSNVYYYYGINTTSLKSIEGMFANCVSLPSLRLTSFDFSNVESFSNVFLNCKNVSRILFKPEQKVKNIIDISSAFSGCENLEEINMETFNFENIKNMAYLFNDCKKLTNITFPINLDTSKVTNIEHMFSGCSELEYFNLSQFNFQNLNDASYLFSNCANLKNVTLDEFNCTNCKSLKGMFSNCTTIENIDLSSFYTSEKLIDISYLFDNCYSLNYIQMCNIILGNNCNIEYSFRNCKELTNINMCYFIMSDNYTYDNYDKMFPEIFYTNLTINLLNATVPKDFIKILKQKNIIITNEPYYDPLPSPTQSSSSNSSFNSSISSNSSSSLNSSSSSNSSINSSSSNEIKSGDKNSGGFSAGAVTGVTLGCVAVVAGGVVGATTAFSSASASASAATSATTAASASNASGTAKSIVSIGATSIMPPVSAPTAEIMNNGFIADDNLSVL